MAVGPFDSSIYRMLLRDEEVAACFDDAAQIESWLKVESALAKAQAGIGLLPADAAAAIEQACKTCDIDPARLAARTGRDAIPVPALLALVREKLAAEHADWLHFGATTQDIVDTGLVLRLRAVCDIVDARLRLLLQLLADLADAHAELPMIARTRRMPATPTSFGAVVAAWGAPLLAQIESLAQLRPRLLRVSLAGAAGNAAALGPRSAELRQALARQLDLVVDDLCWHTDRSALLELASCLTRITAALAKFADDCLFAAAPEVGELKLPAEGGSSTMPHKQNPVLAETLLALHEIALSGDAELRRAAVHRQQRDGAAWLLEWHALPQTCLAAGRTLQIGLALLTRIEPNAARMRANLEGVHGLAHAEAISFRLAQQVPRAEARELVKRLCKQAANTDANLVQLVAAEFADVDWQAVVAPEAQLGDAAEQARRFAELARAT
ncbi:MAG: lyase family protein [Gammaproteobacteria bacterium]|nr:lyase family protein [Gammaproteobacteria bacterium]